MSRTGIFGGTFNPPHLGHKRLAQEIMKIANLDRVIIIPDNVPPHKVANNLLSGEDRLELCRKTFSEDCFEVSDIELHREGKSFTYHTISELKEQYPDDELFLITGSDMILSFHTWFRYKDILSLCTLCGISREDEIDSEGLYFYAKEYLGLERDELIISSRAPFELSSTEVRNKIKNGDSLEGVLEEETMKIIIQKGYYK